MYHDHDCNLNQVHVITRTTIMLSSLFARLSLALYEITVITKIYVINHIYKNMYKILGVRLLLCPANNGKVLIPVIL